MRVKTLLASIAIFLCFFAATPIVYAIGNGDIAIAPAKDSDPSDPRSQSWFIYSFGSGSSHQDKVSVKNESSEVRTLVLYPVDAYTTPQGGFALRNANDPKEHIGKWIELETNTVTLKPGEEKDIAFQYSVSTNAEPGEYAGGIIAQDSQLIQGKGISVVKRVGVRVYHTIPGERNEKLSFISLQMKREKATRWFEVTVENIGNVSLPVSLKEEIMKQNGMSVASLKSDEQTVLPKSRVTLVTNKWKEAFVGSFAAKGAVYKGITVLTEIPAQNFFIISPYLLAGVIFVALVLFIFFFIFILRKKKKKK